MQFIKYPSLTNHYTVHKANFINPNNQYVSTEKIHGSNVSIVIDNQNNIEIAKRTSFLTDHEKTVRPWNTLQNFVTENKALILNWTEQIRNIVNNYGPIEQIHMYGELYGSSVQNMEYAENLNNIRRIRFFDIHILLENNHRLALSQTDMSQIFGDDYTVPVLRTGTLSELIETAVELDSKLGGHAEGEVYKPADRYIFEPDDFDNIHYPVIKQKNERFLEKSTRSVKTPASYTEEEKAVVTAVESRITKQRLLNVLSHGDINIDPKNTGVIIKAMLEDIKSEINREEPELNLAHGHLIGKQGGKIAALFREYLADINQAELSSK